MRTHRPLLAVWCRSASGSGCATNRTGRATDRVYTRPVQAPQTRGFETETWMEPRERHCGRDEGPRGRMEARGG